MKKYILRSFFLAATCAVVFVSRTNQTGPGPGYTNAPSESNCATGGCHSDFALQKSGTKWDKISLSSSIMTNGYKADSVYTLVLSYKEAGISKYGFQITALDQGTNSPAGTFATLDSRTQAYSATIGGKIRRYLGHTSTGTNSVGTDSTAWKIKWTAPTSNVGNIVFYVTLNATNSDNNNTGDVIYAKRFIINNVANLGVKNASSQVEAKVWPNPAGRQLFVHTNQAGKAQFKLYNASGELAILMPLLESHSNVSIASLPNGLYYYSVETADSRSVGRILVSN